MKGLSLFCQSTIILLAIFWLPNQIFRDSSLNVITNPLECVKSYFLDILRPRIERSAIKVPETFMTTVGYH